MRILILTENLFNEQSFQDNLNRLNYEVFVSSSVLSQWRENHFLENLLNTFSIIIVSETIAQSEASKIIASVEEQETIFLRKIESSPTKQLEAKLKEQGFEGWLAQEASLAELREILFKYRQRIVASKPTVVSGENASFNVQVSDILKLNLRVIDEKILFALIQNGKKIVSREDLIQSVWQKEADHSSLSQISYRITRIKENIFKVFGLSSAIVTEWGKGYRLSDEFFEAFVKNDIQI